MMGKNKKRKIISYWVLGILLLGIVLASVFYQITHFSRSSQGDTVPFYEEQRLLKEKGGNINEQ